MRSSMNTTKGRHGMAREKYCKVCECRLVYNRDLCGCCELDGKTFRDNWTNDLITAGYRNSELAVVICYTEGMDTRADERL